MSHWTEPVELRFLIGDDDRAAVAQQFGPKALSADTVVVSGRYGDTKTWWSTVVDETAILGHLVERAGLNADRYVKDDFDATVEALTARPDTVFPLLGALGVDMTQTLINDPDQLLVEGPADVVYLTVMSDVVRRHGGTGLDPRWTLTPVSGIDKIPTFVALLGGNDLNVTVVMDVAAGGNQKIANLVSRGLLDAKRLIPLTDITATAEADIEDLFDSA